MHLVRGLLKVPMNNTTITHRCIIDPTVFSVPVSGAAAALIACCAAIARGRFDFNLAGNGRSGRRICASSEEKVFFTKRTCFLIRRRHFADSCPVGRRCCRGAARAPGGMGSSGQCRWQLGSWRRASSWVSLGGACVLFVVSTSSRPSLEH